MNGVVAVAAGSQQSFTLSRGGAVMASGVNDTGQLGLGDRDNRDTFTMLPVLCDVVDIDAGEKHAIAVTAAGDLFAWGKGPAIGHGDKWHGNPDLPMWNDSAMQCLVPVKVTGGGIDEVVVVEVAAGNCHSMALTAGGSLFTWGQGYISGLGHGNKDPLGVPRIVDGIEGAVVGMAAGDSHSLVTTVHGRVMVFGRGYGLGEGAEVVLVPTVIDGITMGVAGEGKEAEAAAALP
jgi:alpha-tubulin suppressor-like RCC1 family protein